MMAQKRVQLNPAAGDVAPAPRWTWLFGSGLKQGHRPRIPARVVSAARLDIGSQDPQQAL